MKSLGQFVGLRAPKMPHRFGRANIAFGLVHAFPNRRGNSRDPLDQERGCGWGRRTMLRALLGERLGGQDRQVCSFPSYDATGNFTDAVKSASL